MNREQLLAAMDTVAAEPPRPVSIRGLGDVFIREITIGDVDQQIADRKEAEREEAKALEEGKPITAEMRRKRSLARGACRLLCDEAGRLLLDPNNPDDVAKMAKLPLRVLNAIDKASEQSPDDKSGN